MKNATADAIILGNKNFGETDKLVFLYCKGLGKIKAIAKGARKITSKFTGHLITLNFCRVSLYFGPRNIILTEIISLTQKTERIKNELNHLQAGLRIAEITNKMLHENEEVPDLEKLLKHTLYHLKNSQKPELISLAYIIKLLEKQGLMPEFRELKTKIQEKYLKFFNYIITQNYGKIEKIALKKTEKAHIENIILKLIQLSLDLNLSSLETFKTPGTVSNLSIKRSN